MRLKTGNETYSVMRRGRQTPSENFSAPHMCVRATENVLDMTT
jgi:hypothetical protein